MNEICKKKKRDSDVGEEREGRFMNSGRGQFADKLTRFLWVL